MANLRSSLCLRSGQVASVAVWRMRILMLALAALTLVSDRAGSAVLMAHFTIEDAYLANRDNGADLRVFDQGNGAEAIQQVAVALFP